MDLAAYAQIGMLEEVAKNKRNRGLLKKQMTFGIRPIAIFMREWT